MLQNNLDFRDLINARKLKKKSKITKYTKIYSWKYLILVVQKETILTSISWILYQINDIKKFHIPYKIEHRVLKGIKEQNFRKNYNKCIWFPKGVFFLKI